MKTELGERLLIVTNVASPYRHELFLRLSRDVDRLVVAFQVDSEPGRSWDRMPETSYKSHFLHGRSIGLRRRRITLAAGLGKLVEELHPTSIIACGYSLTTLQLALTAKRLKTPFIIMSDGIAGTDPVKGLEYQYRKWLTSLAQGAIASCALAKEYFVHLGASPPQVEVVELTTDLVAIAKRVDALKLRNDLRSGFGVGSRVVLYAGKLVPDKRVVDVIEAFAAIEREVADSWLIIAGDGPDRLALELLVLKRKLHRVRFLGLLGWEPLLEAYAVADVLLFPAIRERFGMVIIEAMAAGMPVIATDEAGATRDLIRDGTNGFVVSPGDVETMAARLRQVLTDSELRTRFSRAARESAMVYDVESESARFLSLVRRTRR